MEVLLLSFQSHLDTVGLKYIHSYLKRNKVDSAILFSPEYNPKTDFSGIRDFIIRNNINILGIGLMSLEFNLAKQFTENIKKSIPGITVIWGGIHPTIDAENCLSYADYVFIGEAEQPFLEFVQNFGNKTKREKTANLAYKDKGKIKINRLMPLTKNLDVFPFPEHFPKESYIVYKNKVVKLNKELFKKYTRYSGKFYSLTTSRGCPFSCAYCCNCFFSKLYKKKEIRKRSVKNVIDELKLAIKLFPDIIYIDIKDDCFLAYDIEWLKEFARIYKKEINKNFVFRTTPAHITDEKLKILKEAGLSWIFMGLQTGSERTNKEIYKRFVPNEKFIEACRIVNKYNLPGYYDVIVDNPYENEQDLIETAKVLLRIPKPYSLSIFSLCFYQGTELYERAIKDGINFENPLEKNFLKYKHKYMNDVIRLTPLLPKYFIIHLIRNRRNFLGNFLLTLSYYPSVFILEPVLFFRLTAKSFNYDIIKTLKMTISFSKTAFRKLFLRQTN